MAWTKANLILPVLSIAETPRQSESIFLRSTTAWPSSAAWPACQRGLPVGVALFQCPTDRCSNMQAPGALGFLPVLWLPQVGKEDLLLHHGNCWCRMHSGTEYSVIHPQRSTATWRHVLASASSIRARPQGNCSQQQAAMAGPHTGGLPGRNTTYGRGRRIPTPWPSALELPFHRTTS